LQHDEIGENGSSVGHAAALGAWSGGLFGGLIGAGVGAARAGEQVGTGLALNLEPVNPEPTILTSS
jgi:hypothetical protein